MAEITSAWGTYPDYRIDLIRSQATGRVRWGDLVLAESDSCLVMEESDHQARLYFPESDVNWEHFEPTDEHTVCPFKGEADYWTLMAADPPEENVVWTYREPFPEVAGIKDYACFYDDRLEVELVEHFPGDADHEVVHRFPPWGDVTDLSNVMDVTPTNDTTFVSPPFPDPPPGDFLPDRAPNRRLVIESGQLLGEGIVAASKAVPGQRVTSASMIFAKAALFDEEHEVTVDILRGGRTFSTVEARITQAGKLRSAGIFLLDSGADDTIRNVADPPDVAGPYESTPVDMAVLGRELRVVDGTYDRQPDETGDPEIHTWVRFREAPEHAYLHAALLAQSTGHWTIAAAMRPHAGITQALAHVTLSTGIMATNIAFHDEFDVSDWLLYVNPATYAGRGLVHGEGRVHTIDGNMVASYSVQAMVREFATDPGAMGSESVNAM